MSVYRYFMEVLRNNELSADCQEVQLLVDGSWKSYFEDSAPDSKDTDAVKSSSSPNRRVRARIIDCLTVSFGRKVRYTINVTRFDKTHHRTLWQKHLCIQDCGDIAIPI